MRRSRKMELLRLLKGRPEGCLASDIIGCRTYQTINLDIGDLRSGDLKPVNEPTRESAESEHGHVETRKICWTKKTFYRLVKQLIEEGAVILVPEPKKGYRGRPAKRYKVRPGWLYMEYPAKREGNLLLPGKWIGNVDKKGVSSRKRHVRVFPQVREGLSRKKSEVQHGLAGEKKD